jgi:hypothetical protein
MTRAAPRPEHHIAVDLAATEVMLIHRALVDFAAEPGSDDLFAGRHGATRTEVEELACRLNGILRASGL